MSAPHLAAALLVLAPLASIAEELHPAVAAAIPEAAEAEKHEAHEEHEAREGATIELSIDLGVEHVEGSTVPTEGVALGWEFSHENLFLLSGAVTEKEGALSGGDVGVGLYHQFELGALNPGVGVEFGAVVEREGEETSVGPFERALVGVFHDFGSTVFAGLIGDAALRGTEHLTTRLLLEVGARL